MSPWPFSDPPDVATFTVRQVVSGNEPVLLVSHDAEDGAWQFLTDSPVEMSDALLVGLAEMVGHDPALAELADLPRGWQASREHKDADWQRSARSRALARSVR